MLYPDAKLSNADWTKKTWDLVDIQNIKSLREYLRKNKISIEHFKELPVYKFNVNKLPWLKEL